MNGFPWFKFKKDDGFWRKLIHSLQYLICRKINQVDFLYLVWIVEKFGMELTQPECFYIRFTSDDRHRAGIRMKTKREVNRGPHILSLSHPGDSGPRPSRYLATLHGKVDDRQARKQFVAMAQDQIERRITRQHYQIQLAATIGISKRSCHVSLIILVFGSRRIHVFDIEVDRPWNAGPQ